VFDVIDVSIVKRKIPPISFEITDLETEMLKKLLFGSENF